MKLLETYYRIKEKFFHFGDNWDKMSPAESEAIAFAHLFINPEPKRMTPNGNFTLEYCLAASGSPISDRYRNGTETEIDKAIANCLSHNHTKKDLVLYRGLCRKNYNDMKINAKNTKNCDLLELGFLHTSLIKGHEEDGQIKLRILVPEGTKAVYLGNVNYEQHLYEVTIQHGAMLKIISRDNNYINCQLLHTA